MRRVRRALPNIKYVVVTVAVCLMIGVLATGGFHPKAFFGLVLAALFLLLVTIRNYDPISWEAFHQPQAHSMRLQRDAADRHLRSIVAAFDEGEERVVTEEIERARKFLFGELPQKPAR